jgi:hypothetical protein
MLSARRPRSEAQFAKREQVSAASRRRIIFHVDAFKQFPFLA